MEREPAAEPELCPCGEELEGPRGGHLLCAKHRQRIASDVARRFGSHRYGGRYAHLVEDIVQECYPKLLGPGGLRTFIVPPGRKRADAFGGWLWVLVENHCHNKLAQLGDGVPCARPGAAAEPKHGQTPEQAFARTALLDLLTNAVAVVAAEWKAKGPKKAQQFEVFIAFVLGNGSSYSDAQEQLDISESNAKQLKSELGKRICQALRELIRDTLSIEPGLQREGIERRINREIEELLNAAFPPEPEQDS